MVSAVSSQEGTRVSLSHTELLADMPAPDAGGCLATREILDRIGDKWSLYIVAMLANGPRRFNELKRSIDGISQRMLTLTLRGLERDGLVSRRVLPTTPVAVEYALTPLGETLIAPMAAIHAWAEAHVPEMLAARRAYEEQGAR